MKATLTWYRLLPKIFLIGILKKSRRLEHWELEQWDRTLNNIILQNVKTVQDSPKPTEGPFKRWRDQICDCFGLIILTVWKVSKCGAFLVRIFLYSDWIQENTDQKKLRAWALFFSANYWKKCKRQKSGKHVSIRVAQIYFFWFTTISNFRFMFVFLLWKMLLG